MEPTQSVLTEQKKDSIKEGIKFNTELIKIFTLIALALATGIASLTFKLIETQENYLLVMIVLGSIVLFTFVTISLFLISKNMKRIKLLSDD